MGIRSLAADFGIQFKRTDLLVDATAGIGIMSRRGLGKIRHMDVNGLCLQLAVKDNQVSLSKVDTKDKFGDLGTSS